MHRLFHPPSSRHTDGPEFERVPAVDHDESYLAQARFAAEISGLGIEFRRLSVYICRCKPIEERLPALSVVSQSQGPVVLPETHRGPTEPPSTPRVARSIRAAVSACSAAR